jgi:hypothetical protein
MGRAPFLGLGSAVCAAALTGVRRPSYRAAPARPVTRSIQEGLRQARQQGDDKKLGMVASRK